MLIFKIGSGRIIRLLSLMLVIAVTMGFAYFFVASEHTFYWWDFSGYQEGANQTAQKLRELPFTAGSLSHAAYDIWKSTVEDYSELYKVPLVPFLWMFGDSRQAFILSLTALYLLPFCMIVGLIASSLTPQSRQQTFWLAVGFCLLTPATWASTLRGYPDVGAACLSGLAIWLYLDERHAKDWRKLVGSGCLLGLAVLVRRHFAYELIAFFVAGIVQLLFSHWNIQKFGVAALQQGMLRLMAVAVGCVGLLLTVGFPFVYRLATTNFSLLYSSYSVPAIEGLAYFGGTFGWITWLIAFLGLAIGIARNVISRSVGVWLGVFGSYALLQWIFLVGQKGYHYSLHFVVFIVLGLTSAWLWGGTLGNGGLRRLFSIGFVACCLLNFTIGSWISPGLDEGGLNLRAMGMRTMVAAGAQPLQRSDYEEVLQLLKYLRDSADRGDTVYVAASSDILNDDILRHAHNEHYKNDHKIRFLYSPHIDSRDTYPLEQLLQARFVVIATPLQTHLHAKEQKVVDAVLSAFQQNWIIAQDFQLEPRKITLHANVQVQIWKRVRPTTMATTLRTAEAVESFVGQRPGSQRSWIALDTSPGYWILKFRDGTWHIATESVFGRSGGGTSFLNIDPPNGRNQIEGNLQAKGCAYPELSFESIDQLGNVVASTATRPRADRFVLHLDIPNAYRLRFSVGETSPSCTLKIDNLRLDHG
jgi:hypothetical protein